MSPDSSSEALRVAKILYIIAEYFYINYFMCQLSHTLRPYSFRSTCLNLHYRGCLACSRRAAKQPRVAVKGLILRAVPLGSAARRRLERVPAAAKKVRPKRVFKITPLSGPSPPRRLFPPP